MKTRKLNKYIVPTISTVKMHIENEFLESSIHINVSDSPADKTDILSKKHFDIDLWTTEDEETID